MRLGFVRSLRHMGEGTYSNIAALDVVMSQIHVPVALSAHKISDIHCKSGWCGFEFGLEGLKKSISLTNFIELNRLFTTQLTVVILQLVTSATCFGLVLP